ncbi:MAG: sigma-70 family RNA polymerase sigma factor [Reichenbachiella sp.]|uniref:RNA polymerase sigma factor n=1 Tax=Reichenbachiella sp. TaxID=2184521 RepID=UPI0032652D07
MKQKDNSKTTGLDLGKGDEQTIWKNFVNDNQDALSQMYEAYSQKLYNYCRQFDSDDSLIWDVIQDLFYDLIRRKKHLAIPNSVTAYLLSSVRRKIIERLEQKKKAKEQSFDPDKHAFQVQISEENELIKRELSSEQKQRLEKACNELPVKQREAILLKFYEGLSYEEIAQVMDMTKNKSARALVYRGLQSLSIKLSDMDPKKGLAVLYTISMV